MISGSGNHISTATSNWLYYSLRSNNGLSGQIFDLTIAWIPSKSYASVVKMAPGTEYFSL